MNKRASVSEQIKYLKSKNIEVDDEPKLEQFLLKYPYQKTIKQVKFLYKNSNNNYMKVKSSQVISDYNLIFKDSVELLGSILLLENEMKNLVFISIYDIYLSSSATYNEIIKKVIPNTKTAYKHAYKNSSIMCCGEEKDHAANCGLLNLYKNEIYRIINACNLKELGEIIQLLLSEKYLDYGEICNSVLKCDEKSFGKVLRSALFNVYENAAFSNINSTEIWQIFSSQFDNLILKSLLESKYPIEILTTTDSVIRGISDNKIKKKFREHKDDLFGWFESIDMEKKKKDIKASVKNCEVLQNVKKQLFTENKDVIVDKVIKSLFFGSVVNGLGTLNIQSTNLIYDLIDNNEHIRNAVYMNIFKKTFSIISQFRNTIAHGQTLITPLKNEKDITYKKVILQMGINRSNYYITFMNKHVNYKN